MLMTRSQYASHRGCELTAVIYAIKAGRIQTTPTGLIESVAADKNWDENTDALRSRILSHNGKSGSAGSVNGVQADGNRQPVTIEFLTVRTERERQMVELKKVELEVKLGKLVRRTELEAAQKVVYGQVRALRDACLEIPDRLAPALAAAADARDVREILWKELIDVFARFADGKPKDEAAA